ncbi:MAG: hypothetical protein IJS54_01130 [Desulfovibrio sp.]|nr:hypothetical protein [Desulfovibrio sp.]
MRVRHLFFPIVAVFLSFLCLGACAHKPKEHVVPQESIVQTPLESQIAQFIGQAPEGASQHFSGTHYGTGLVTVGGSYYSALNMECREARIQGSSRSRIAACKDPEKGWILAPDITGDGSL